MRERNPDTVRLASGTLEIAQQRMVREYPFHARFIASWRLHSTTDVPTMGVTVEGDAIILFYHPDFAVACSFPELVGVLHHEVNHLLFEHVFLEPARFPDHQALVIAEEVTANEWIREPLPGMPLLLSQFPQLPTGEDTLTRYWRLARKSAGTDFRPGLYRKGGPMDPKSPPMVPNSPAVEPKNPQPGIVPDHPATFDDHRVWEKARISGPVGEMVLRVLVREAAGSLSREQWQGLPPAIRDRISDICRSDVPGSVIESLIPVGAGRLDWRRLLQRYVREATQGCPVFTRPPRRFLDLVGIVPGRLHRPTRATVMVVIDTSGSIGKAMLEMIACELDRISSSHAVTVVECDAIVHRVYPYQVRLSEVQGRGGTDLRPPFDPALLGRVKPSVIVYFTDGYGQAPVVAPPIPTIWCITAGGQTPASWGREIRLPSL